MVGALVATMIDIKFLWYQRLAMWHWICKTISIWYYLKSYSLGSSRCLLVVRKEKYDPTRAIFIVLLVCGFICIVCDFEIRESQKWVENWYWLVTENFVRNWKKYKNDYGTSREYLHVTFITRRWHWNIQTKALTVIDSLNDFVVLCDLLGGTPTNIISKLIMEGQQIKLYVGLIFLWSLNLSTRKWLVQSPSLFVQDVKALYLSTN